MAQRNWDRDELLLAMNLYCRLPFGKMHKGNPEIMALATTLGRTPSSVAMKLANLASLDPSEQARGIAGLTKASAADRAIWEEFHTDWEAAAYESETAYRQRVPAMISDPSQHVGLTPRRSPDDPILNQQSAIPNLPADDAVARRSAAETETIRNVKVRTAQDFFRRAVLASYRTKCCISGIALADLLVASHILPWGKFPDHRVDPRNGLCLSRLHDAAFDRGLITFDADLRLVLSRELHDHTTNAVLAAAFTPFAGQPLSLPDKFQPEQASFERHRELVFRG